MLPSFARLPTACLLTLMPSLQLTVAAVFCCAQSGLIDTLLIATPHYYHTTIGIEAFAAGLHVLTEKPISVHKADCERLIAAYFFLLLYVASLLGSGGLRRARTQPAPGSWRCMCVSMCVYAFNIRRLAQV